MKRLGFTLGFIAVPLAADAAHLGSVRAPKRSMRAPKLVSLRDGLRYVDLVVGKGARPRTGQLVTVTYVGTSLHRTTLARARSGFRSRSRSRYVIGRIAKFRVKEVAERAKRKADT